MEPADALQKFIESIGHGSEAEFWLKLFRAEARERFATVVVEAPVLQYAFDAVVVDLRFLAAVGLTPVVVVGVYDPTDAQGRAHRLQQGLAAAQVPSVVVPYAGAGERREPVVAATDAHRIPIVPLGHAAGADAQSRFDCLGRLVRSLLARKVIFVSQQGAFRRRCIPLPIVNLTTEYDELRSSPDLTEKQIVLLEQARRLVLEQVKHKLHVAVTSPFDLLRELFTVKGAGTLLRRGAMIQVSEGFSDVDRVRLRDLLIASFGRPPRDDFFDRHPSHVYVEESYLGAAIIFATSLGAYLSKFAVDRQAQGEGLGRDLWARFTADHPVCYWRSRARNPINSWYMKECDGFVRSGDWLVFWKGLAPERIAEAVSTTLAMPDDMGSPV